MSPPVTRSSLRAQNQPISRSTPAAKATKTRKPLKPSKTSASKRRDEETGKFITARNAPRAAQEPPSTPQGKRAKTKPFPQTPTTAQPSLMTPCLPSSALTPPPRPAEPTVTNAAIKTPGGTRLTAYKDTSHTLPPPPTTLPRPTTTTTSLLSDACAHLIAADPRLAPIIARHPCHIFSPAGLAEVVDPFVALASSIISQQVSGAAASSIKRKFVALFHPPSPPDAGRAAADDRALPTPAIVAAVDVAFLRTAGLSGRKAEYIHGLATKFASGDLTARMLIEASYEELLEKLIAVRGLGRWTVEMFACFGLKRMDVISTGDLAVQRGMAAFVGKDVGKLKAKGGGKFKYMSEQDMLHLSAKFAPYRSLFMWYMWRVVEDVNIDALEGVQDV